MIIQCAHEAVVPIADLQLNPRNRNVHPQAQIERLAKIMAYQGWRYPVKVSKRSGMVVSGHGRIQAALLNGWTECPVDYQDYESDEQEQADAVADNAIASWAELDLAGINADLSGLGPDLDLDMLGISDFTLDVADKDIQPPNIANFEYGGTSKKKIYTCPNCEMEFEEAQAMVRVEA